MHRLKYHGAWAHVARTAGQEVAVKRLSILAFGFGLLLLSFPAAAQDKLVVSIWGGSWRDLVAETVAKKFTQKPAWPWSSSPAAPSTVSTRRNSPRATRRAILISQPRMSVGSTLTTTSTSN